MAVNASEPTESGERQGEEDPSEGAVCGNVENGRAQLVKVASEFAQLDTGKFPHINVGRRQALSDLRCFWSEEVIPWAGVAGDDENSAGFGRRRVGAPDIDAVAGRDRG
ncbi:MAG: hypothetical protein ACT4NY_25680 [Pseudonocardiales bacterium]